MQVQLLKTSLCLIWDNCALFQLKGNDQGKVTIFKALFAGQYLTDYAKCLYWPIILWVLEVTIRNITNFNAVFFNCFIKCWQCSRKISINKQTAACSLNKESVGIAVS